MAWGSEGWSNTLSTAGGGSLPTGGVLTNFVAGDGSPTGSVDIDGVFNTFLNGTRITQIDGYTLRFENRFNETRPSDPPDTNRCQASGVFIDMGVQWDLNFLFRIEAPGTSTATWFVISEMQDDPAMTALSPPWAVEIVTGTKLALVVRWAPGTSGAGWQQQWVYTAASDCVPGRDYNIRLQGRVQNTGAGGFITMWVDGVQVASYTGMLGYGNRNYYVFGLYRQNVPETFSAQFSRVTLTVP